MNYYIYKITNKINNKCYIGQSRKIRDRWVNHRRSASLVKEGKKTISDPGIQVVHLALAKHGIENFSFKIIEELDTQDQANDRETYWVSHYDSLNNGYNCTPGGYNAPKTEEWKRKVKASRMANGGYGHSDETKQRMSKEWHKYHTPESIEKVRKANLGKKLTKKHKEAIRKANTGNTHCKGHKQPKEVIEKRKSSISKKYGSTVCNAPGCQKTDGHKFNGVRYCSTHIARLQRNGSLILPPRPKPMLGKSPSKETREKISKSKKGKCTGSDNPFYGKKHDAETMERIRQANLGKEPPNKMKFSQDDIDKIINDPRGLRKVAKDFGVSITVIRRIRREYG